MDLNTLASKAIRTARQSAGLSRAALLKRAGNPIVMRWLITLEQGRARWRLEDLEVLARAMGHDPLELLAAAKV